MERLVATVERLVARCIDSRSSTLLRYGGEIGGKVEKLVAKRDFLNLSTFWPRWRDWSQGVQSKELTAAVRDRLEADGQQRLID